MKSMQMIKTGIKNCAKYVDMQALVRAGKSELREYLNYTGMKTGMMTGKSELKEYLKRSGMKAVSEMRDTNRKRILGVMIQRREDALDVLDCVKAKAQMPYDAAAGKKKLALESVILSPVVSMLLSLNAFVFTMIFAFSTRPDAARAAAGSMDNAWLLPLLFTMLILGQAIYGLFRKTKEAAAIRPQPEAEVLLDTEQAKVQMEKQLSRLIADSEAVCGMFQSQALDGMNAYEDELVKLYASLYEAKLDRPECEEFNYSLTMAEMMLRQIGLKTVAYSEEKKKLFNIDVEDYRDEMRTPAIVREKTGEVVRKGEYIRNIHEVKNHG